MKFGERDGRRELHDNVDGGMLASLLPVVECLSASGISAIVPWRLDLHGGARSSEEAGRKDGRSEE